MVSNYKFPEANVTVAVKYLIIKYKDGMIQNCAGWLVRYSPHISGIVFCGVAEWPSPPDYKQGDEVALTSWRVSEIH